MKQLVLFSVFSHLVAISQVTSYPLHGYFGPVQPIEHLDHPLLAAPIDRSSGEVLYEDDFSEPSNWTLSALVETANWEIITDEPIEVIEYIGEMASTTEANGFALFNGVQYLLDETATVQDAILTFNTTMNCLDRDHVTLEFEQRYRQFYNNQTWVEVSDNNGLTYDYSFQINQEIVPNAPSVQGLKRINITEAAAGKEFVKIRFRWICTEEDPIFGSGYAWMIDDFLIRDSWYYDQEINAAYHRSGIGGYMPNGLDYYEIPTNQLTTLYLSGKTENKGGKIQENAKLNVEISGPSLDYKNSEPVNLPINSTDSLGTTSTFTPTPIGTYQLKYWFDSDSTEAYTLNDTLYTSFKRTETIYSRQNGVINGNIRNIEGNFEQPFVIGNVMELFQTTAFCKINIGVSNSPTNVGRMIYSKVYRYDESSMQFVFIDQTLNHTITAGENGGMITLFMVNDLILEAGSILLVTAGHYGGATEVEFRMAQKVEEQTVLGYVSDQMNPFISSTQMPL